MAVRVTYLAIALGGACGAFAALVGAPNLPRVARSAPPASSLPLRPIAELGRPTSSASPKAQSAEPQTLAALVASASASATATATAPSVTPAPSDSTPLPDTKEALLRAEMHCDQKDASACILAARAYEAGSAGRSDADKASKYRKIALTHWISQCDHNSASACATLADMYRAGRGVPQSERNATALLERARELCHYNDAPACHDLPPAP